MAKNGQQKEKQSKLTMEISEEKVEASEGESTRVTGVKKSGGVIRPDGRWNCVGEGSSR